MAVPTNSSPDCRTALFCSTSITKNGTLSCVHNLPGHFVACVKFSIKPLNPRLPAISPASHPTTIVNFSRSRRIRGLDNLEKPAMSEAGTKISRSVGLSVMQARRRSSHAVDPGSKDKPHLIITRLSDVSRPGWARGVRLLPQLSQWQQLHIFEFEYYNCKRK